MMTAVWIVTAVMVYLVVWIGVSTFAERDCEKDEHDHCEHTFDGAVWPLWLAIIVLITPFIVLTDGVKALSHRLAQAESPRKVRARREAEAVAASQARIAAMKERTRQLEIENDIPPMWHPPTGPESDPVRRRGY